MRGNTLCRLRCRSCRSGGPARDEHDQGDSPVQQEQGQQARYVGYMSAPEMDVLMTESSGAAVDFAVTAMEAKLATLFDDPDFNGIHQRLSPFNLFEAVGAIRAELRHSNFLAYLLAPARPHGLGARPLIAVLRAIFRVCPLMRDQSVSSNS